MRILIDSHRPEAEEIRQALRVAGNQADILPHELNLRDGRAGYDFLVTDISRDDDILKNGNVELDKAQHTLKRNKKNVRVTPLEFKIIEFFMEHQGEIIKKDALANGCWSQDKNVSNNTIEVYVKRIRGKLGASSIRTIHGIGYQMDKKLKLA